MAGLLQKSSNRAPETSGTAISIKRKPQISKPPKTGFAKSGQTWSKGTAAKSRVPSTALRDRQLILGVGRFWGRFMESCDAEVLYCLVSEFPLGLVPTRKPKKTPAKFLGPPILRHACVARKICRTQPFRVHRPARGRHFSTGKMS